MDISPQKKSIISVIYNGDMLKSFLLDWERSRMPAITTFLQCCSGGPRQWNKTMKKIKISVRKEKKITLLFENDILVCIENPKEYTNKLLKLLSNFNIMSLYKNQLNFCILTTNKLKVSTTYNRIKSSKYLGLCLKKKCPRPRPENCKTCWQML